MARERLRERCPGRCNLVDVPAQRLPYVGTDAVDVNVKLVLCASERRVDRQTHPVAWQRHPSASIDEHARTPRVREVVRRAWLQKPRALDAAYPVGGDNQKL